MAALVIEKPLFKPDIAFRPEVDSLEERATIVHITYIGFFNRLRIWPTTYLIQEDGSRKQLLHAFNIGAYPQWKLVQPGHRFTLIFEGLDKSCKVFDMLEDIPEPGEFRIQAISRNEQDIYHLNLY